MGAGLTVALALAFLAGCGAPPEPPRIPPGPLSYQHRPLGGENHVIVVSAEPGIAESEGDVVHRIRMTSGQLAKGICPDGFDVLHEPDFEGFWLERFNRRTESYVFACN